MGVRGVAQAILAVLRPLSLVALVIAVAFLLKSMNDPPSEAPVTSEAQTSPISASTGPPTSPEPAPPTSVVATSYRPAPPEPALPTPAVAATYRRIQVLEITYGSGAGQVGLVARPESRPFGPTAFAVDGAGTVYLGDSANYRVQVYSPAGKHVRAIPVEAPIRDLAADDVSSLYALSPGGTVDVFDKSSGKPKGRWSVAGGIARASPKLRLVGDALHLESNEQTDHPLSVQSPTGPVAVGEAEQIRGEKKGVGVRSGALYSTSYRDQGHVYRRDDRGNVLQDVALGLPDILSAIFLDEDRAGSFYVQVERLDERGQVAVEVRRFNRKGALDAVIPIEPVTYTALTRSVVVTADGDLIEMIPTSQTVRLVRWQHP